MNLRIDIKGIILASNPCYRDYIVSQPKSSEQDMLVFTVRFLKRLIVTSIFLASIVKFSKNTQRLI